MECSDLARQVNQLQSMDVSKTETIGKLLCQNELLTKQNQGLDEANHRLQSELECNIKTELKPTPREIAVIQENFSLKAKNEDMQQENERLKETKTHLENRIRGLKRLHDPLKKENELLKKSMRLDG